MNKKVITMSKFLNVALKGLALLSVIFLFFTIFTFNSSEVTFTLGKAGFPIYFHSSRGVMETPALLNRVENIQAIVGMIMLLISVATYYISSNIFQNIALGESPFQPIQISRLKTVARLYVGNFLIYTFLPTILYFFFIEGTYVDFVIDGQRLITATIFFMLAEIVSYGTQLQQDVDETL